MLMAYPKAHSEKTACNSRQQVALLGPHYGLPWARVQVQDGKIALINFDILGFSAGFTSRVPVGETVSAATSNLTDARYPASCFWSLVSVHATHEIRGNFGLGRRFIRRIVVSPHTWTPEFA